jgi:hypothetical protein
MRINDPVIWHGRIYRLRGFDPMSVVEDRRVYLDDPDGPGTMRVPVEEIEPAPPEAAAG